MIQNEINISYSDLLSISGNNSKAIINYKKYIADSYNENEHLYQNIICNLLKLGLTEKIKTWVEKISNHESLSFNYYKFITENKPEYLSKIMYYQNKSLFEAIHNRKFFDHKIIDLCENSIEKKILVLKKIFTNHPDNEELLDDIFRLKMSLNNPQKELSVGASNI